MTEKKPIILLVDDREDFLETMSERISLKGFQVLTATSGGDAVEQAKKNQIDLAVVDMQMPDMDGLVCITELKKLQPEMETVLLTGYGSEKVRQASDALDTPYFEKQEMGGFWEFLKHFASPPTFLLVDDDEDFLQTMSCFSK
jgi:two-component system response regulator AtoC